MNISFKEGFEELQLTYPETNPKEPGEVKFHTVLLPVDYGLGLFAMSAMLKGFDEYFMKELGQQLDPEMLQAVEKNVASFKERVQKAKEPKSNLILP